MKCMLNENKLSQIHLDNTSYRPNHKIRTVCVIIEIQNLVEKIAINTSTFLINTNTFNTNDCQYQYWQYPNTKQCQHSQFQCPQYLNTIPSRYNQKPILIKTGTIKSQWLWFWCMSNWEDIELAETIVMDSNGERIIFITGISRISSCKCLFEQNYASYNTIFTFFLRCLCCCSNLWMRKDVRKKTVGDEIRTGMIFFTFLSKETTHDNSSFYDLYFSLDNLMKKNPIGTAVLTGIYKLRESDRLFGFFFTVQNCGIFTTW